MINQLTGGIDKKIMKAFGSDGDRLGQGWLSKWIFQKKISNFSSKFSSQYDFTKKSISQEVSITAWSKSAKKQ